MKIKGEKLAVQVRNADELIKLWHTFHRGVEPDRVVDIPGWIGKLSDIQTFRLVPDCFLTDAGATEKAHEEYMANLRRIRNLTPTTRATRLGIFKLLNWGFTGENLNDDAPLAQEAIGLQEKFYTENPLRVHCDPAIFKPLLGEWKLCDKAVLRIVENCVLQDRFAARSL